MDIIFFLRHQSMPQIDLDQFEKLDNKLNQFPKTKRRFDKKSKQGKKTNKRR